ncbi:MAG: hypothetical protein NVSMB5_07610 [Candidatus Velthaea sp.]
MGYPTCADEGNSTRIISTRGNGGPGGETGSGMNFNKPAQGQGGDGPVRYGQQTVRDAATAHLIPH